MKIKEGLEISSGDFWYDLTGGGYLDPMTICENPEDGAKVKAAVDVVLNFQESCEEQIEGFIQ